ncbi:MAG: hypothetical protein JO087_06620 [Actinobacteria bacterium]|nr:hypothetical protein [Actinomycetota bacterium]
MPYSAHTGSDSTKQWLLAPAVAGGLALLAVAAGWRGSDLPAHIYRVGLFHRQGLTLWDPQWYGGQWTLSYSVLFPPTAGLLGIQVTEVLSAAGAAWAFDQLVVHNFGRSARVGSLLFAVGTLAQVAIGQLPFLMGEALGLAAWWALTRRRQWLGAVLAAAASMSSPLAGAFLLLASATSVLVSPAEDRRRACVVAFAASAPLLGVWALFPGSGIMPFPAGQLLSLLAMLGIALVVVPSRHAALRVGVGLYGAAAVVSYVAATPMGANVSRLAAAVGAPLLLCAVWRTRRWLGIAALVPLMVLQWNPAYATVTTERSDPSTRPSYFRPLLSYLGRHAEPLGRVEIVPTELHWEAAYTAPDLLLARGWERQLDRADNPIFYSDEPLDGRSYRRWLLDNGVRFVALPDVHLDYAAQDEGRLLHSGVAGLVPVWHDRHWRVFEVAGSSGLVDGPARLVHMNNSQIDLQANATGTAILRVRYSPRWTIAGDAGCLMKSSGDWLAVQIRRPGPLRLGLSLLGGQDCD